MGSNIAFDGARGSNAGDQFHELWALQQALSLLVPKTPLKAISVEGVRTEISDESDESPTWDGVDCTLYYGGSSLETADSVEFIQLKYSASDPKKNWSTSRLIENTKKTGNNSVIRKLADDFKDGIRRKKQGALLKSKLVSNQKLSPQVENAISQYRGDPSRGLSGRPMNIIQKLQAASGLSDELFDKFIYALDFSECGHDSRFKLRKQVVEAVEELISDSALSDTKHLQYEIRELMMPESNNELVTVKDILLWFGISSSVGLFPCPPNIQVPDHLVERAVAKDILDKLSEGHRLLLVHGEGGCGKTTLLHQIRSQLPNGSTSVFFDCFGSGRYLFSDDKRHLPHNAFTQMANDLAISLNLPLFISNSKKNPADIKSFLHRLKLAGKMASRLNPDGFVVVIIDAADNSITAAADASIPEQTFIHELVASNLSELPSNVRIIVSSRTARREGLQLPAGTVEVPCGVFTAAETADHLSINSLTTKQAKVEHFHSLTHGNPRVQSYAIASANGDISTLFDTLLPSGKGLSDVLDTYFQAARQKLGQEGGYQKLINALAVLPSPICLRALAYMSDLSSAVVRDFVLDLAPGLKLEGETVTIADEDFDDFITARGEVDETTTVAELAEYFYQNYLVDSYSSIHVADFLVSAGRSVELLKVIEKDAKANSAINDPILSRQTQINRLKKVFLADSSESSPKKALKALLLSAEATQDEYTLKKMLQDELDLSVEFANSYIRSEILLSSDHIDSHGSFLALNSARAARLGYRTLAFDQLHHHGAWLRRRRKLPKDSWRNWSVTDLDIAARAEAKLELSGPNEAFRELLDWSPREASLQAAIKLIPNLIASNREELVEQGLQDCDIPKPWDLLPLAYLAIARRSIDSNVVAASLKRIRPSVIPGLKGIRGAYGNKQSWQEALLGAFIFACEFAIRLNVDGQIILAAVNKIIAKLEGDQNDLIHSSSAIRIDGIIRCWIVREFLIGKEYNQSRFSNYLESLDYQKIEEASKKTKNLQGEKFSKEFQKVADLALPIFTVYKNRFEILWDQNVKSDNSSKKLEEIKGLTDHGYSYDDIHGSRELRRKAAEAVMDLLCIRELDATSVFEAANNLRKTRHSHLLYDYPKSLWSKMLLCPEEANFLLTSISAYAEQIKPLREAASEKMSVLINLARLLLPVSRDDSEALFNDAIEIAKDIDLEAVDQIEFVSELAQKASPFLLEGKADIAAKLYGYTTIVAERLSGFDIEFPWTASVRALTSLDTQTALASVSRWADLGAVGLYKTLPSFIITALHRDEISAETATALLLAIDGGYRECRGAIIDKAIKCSQKNTVLDELSRQALLLTSQDSRESYCKQVVEFSVSDNQGEGSTNWIEVAKDTASFIVQLRRDRVDVDTDDDRRRSGGPLTYEEPVFELFPKGEQFTTSESIVSVLRWANENNLRYHQEEILQKMRIATALRNRILFLEALTEIPQTELWGDRRFSLLHSALEEWGAGAAIKKWCKEKLPQVLTKYFAPLTRYLKEGQSIFDELLEMTDSDSGQRLSIIRNGVAMSEVSLSSKTLFGVGERLIASLGRNEAQELITWYTQRLWERLPADDQSIPLFSEPLGNVYEATGRFLFALLADIDSRNRWRAAHVLRLLAKFGCSEELQAVIAQKDRTKDDSFSTPSAPFYFLAAKLWLMIAAHRISDETPEKLLLWKEPLWSIATSSELPHVAIQEYAKRTLLQLHGNGVINLEKGDLEELAMLNAPSKGYVGEKKISHRRSIRSKRDGKRFSFDEMDTIPYWYEGVVRLFPQISMDDFLTMAERWIVDAWEATSTAGHWDKEPRKGRYDDRRYMLWGHRHGSIPIIDRYRTYLEWHAMHCVVGELLKTQPVSKTDDYYDSFNGWLKRCMISDPPHWVSDLRQTTPLEPRMWTPDSRTDRGWLHNVRRDEFLDEIGMLSSSRPGWLVVDASYETLFTKRENYVRINSALVSPGTALPLLRALQTATNPWDFRIPDEHDDMQIDTPPYRLKGWLKDYDHDLGFDENDPFRYETSCQRTRPGSDIFKHLSMIPHGCRPGVWVEKDTYREVFIYEAWCDEPSPEQENYYSRKRSSGWRLWVRKEILQRYLEEKKMDLIVEVQFNKELRNNEYSTSYSDKKRKIHEKILLLRTDGAFEEAEGGIGSWAKDC